MADVWIDQSAIRARLTSFFEQRKRDLTQFGTTVNQTFEAYVFAQVVSVYRAKPGWKVALVHPKLPNGGRPSLRLKFSTRGRPGNYSYAQCDSPAGESFHVRHQLRVSTRSYDYKEAPYPKANICLDVAVIRALDLRTYSTDMHVNNEYLVSFGEAKHMSAFAELVANFVGLVHELQPERLTRIRTKRYKPDQHPAPFLFVSGRLWATAEGLVRTIERRRYDVDVYWQSHLLNPLLPLPTRAPTSADMRSNTPMNTDERPEAPRSAARPASEAASRRRDSWDDIPF